MATETVSLHPEDAANQIHGQIALLQWIENARVTLVELASHRKYSPKLKELLGGVPVPREWGDEESEALQFLLLDMSMRVAAMATASIEPKHV